MAKWGLFAAHRYLEPDAGGRRTIGRDGRPLRRPWRVVTPDTAAMTARHRAMRPQPVWPRPLGVLFLLLAGVAAMHPVDPIPRHVAGSSSAPPASLPLRLEAVSPAGPQEGVPTGFVWQVAGPTRQVSIVFCDASYEPVGRVDGIAGSSYRPTAAIATVLQQAGTFHWFVETTADGHLVRSALQTCQIR